MAAITPRVPRALVERIARTEEQVRTLHETSTARHKEVQDDLKALAESVKAIELSLSKYTGIVGGMMLAITAVWACITLGWDAIKAKFFPGSDV